MKTLTADELAKVLAGGDSYIRTKNLEVKGLAITPDKNPKSPDIIIVGKGPRRTANARLYLDSRKFVPVYIKQATNQWKYLGHYKADRYDRDPATIKKYHHQRPIDEIDGILFLSAQNNLEISVSSHSSPDPKTKKKIEVAAINFVTSYYENLRYSVKDCQKESCGYDLLVEKKNKFLKIEVKGTSGEVPQFFITKNERARSADPSWRLALVTNTLSTPMMEIFNADEMEKKFNFDPLCWKCKGKEFQ